MTMPQSLNDLQAVCPDVVQSILACTIIAWLFWEFRDFFHNLMRFFLFHPVQAMILGLVYLLVYGVVGNPLGLPHLIWNEEPVTRFYSSFGATLLLAVIGINAFFLVPITEEDNVNKRVEIGLKKRGWRWNRVWFVPAENHWSEARQMSRFLQLVRVPFLTLLALPSLLPGAFLCAAVPRFAPVVTTSRNAPHESRIVWHWNESWTPDVDRNIPAWLFGAIVWNLGIFLGVLIAELGIKFGPAVNQKFVRPLRSRVRLKFDNFTWRVISWIGRLWWKSSGNPKVAIASRQPNSERSVYLRISRHKTNAILTFFLMVSTFYICIATIAYEPLYWGTWRIYGGISPALAIFILLGLIAMLSSALSLLRRRTRLVLSLLGVLVVGFANSGDYKLRFDGMSYDKGKRIRLPEDGTTYYVKTKLDGNGSEPQKPDPNLVSNDDALDNWKRFVENRKRDSGPKKPKLVVVCVTGGASRSAYWSTVVLKRLGGSIPGFEDHVRVICGASGGMVGTSYYVKALYDLRTRARSQPQRVEAETTVPLPLKGLWRVAPYMALRDPWKMLIPFRVGPTEFDRGMALERDWKGIQTPFKCFRGMERAGELPSLIFSPMTVDDGRRLLISNLDLRRMKDNDGNNLDDPLIMAFSRGSAVSDQGRGPELRPYSISGTEFYKVFGQQGDELKLSTAARMSASFPFVSPAVSLPTEPPLRVVDAGYYDTYGVNVAGAWLSMNRDWITKNCSGVVMVQIRDSISRQERLGYPPEGRGWGRKFLNGFQFLSSVIDSILKARESASMFRNDAQVAGLSNSFSGPKERGFFTTVFFENSAYVSIAPPKSVWSEIPKNDEGSSTLANSSVQMSWYITQSEKRAMDDAIPSEISAQEALKSRFLGDPAKRCEWVETLKQAAENEKDLDTKSYIYRQYERALNYERLQSLAKWWDHDYSFRN